MIIKTCIGCVHIDDSGLSFTCLSCTRNIITFDFKDNYYNPKK